MTQLNETHDPTALSWVAGADQHSDFPLQNLPFGVFRHGSDSPRGGVAIGSEIVDLAASLDAGLFDGEGAAAAKAASGPTLNPLFDLPASATSALRRQLFAALKRGADEGKPVLIARSEVEMMVPVAIGAFTDFLCSYHHAFRVTGGNPAPAFEYLPIAYNSRASSVGIGPTVRRPLGQSRLPDGSVQFGPEPTLDYELEIGAFLRAGNTLGQPMTMAEARDAIFGYCLLNDWSARSIQFFETQPLGPFLGKNFATTISPWIVTAEALLPFRSPATPRRDGASSLAAYLADEVDQARGNLDVELEAWISSERMRAAGQPEMRLVRTNAKVSYWTVAQMIAHHASNGCNLRPGDLIGSGTLSGPTDEARACLLETSQRGTAPFPLPGGETRCYLEDGDEVVFRGHARRAGTVSIGFGTCRARVLPAPVQ